MSENPEKEEILVSQLATEPYLLSRGRLDNRKLTKIRSSKETPDTYAAYLYFGITDTIIEAHKNRVPIGINQALLNNSLVLTIGINGDGRRDVLYGEQVKRGVGISLNKEIPRPTLYDKIMRRDIVKKYEQQEAEDMNLE